MPNLRQLLAPDLALLDDSARALNECCPFLTELHVKCSSTSSRFNQLQSLHCEQQLVLNPHPVPLGSLYPRLQRLVLGDCDDYASHLLRELPTLIELAVTVDRMQPAPLLSDEGPKLGLPLRVLCATQSVMHSAAVLSYVSQLVVVHLKLVDTNDSTLHNDTLARMLLGQRRLQRLWLNGPVRLVQRFVDCLLPRLTDELEAFELRELTISIAPAKNQLVPLLTSRLCVESLERLEVVFNCVMLETNRTSPVMKGVRLKSLTQLCVSLDEWGELSSQVLELERLASVCPVDGLALMELYGPALVPDPALRFNAAELVTWSLARMKRAGCNCVRE